MHDAPTPPDPYQTANAQTQSNLATAKATQEMNMVNQSNAKGSLNYTQTGTNPDGTPIYSANTTLSAPMQGIYDKSTGLVNSLLGGSAGGALSGKPLDLSYNGTAAALDKLNKARLDPQWAQATDQQESKLAAQGVTPGTPAYDNAMRVFNQGKNDAYNSANLADYQTSANNALAEYNAPLATLGSVYGVANSSGSPTFANTPTSNVAGTNVAGLVEQNYQQQSQNANAYNGQLAGLIGTGLGTAANIFTGGTSGAMGGLFGKSGGGGVAGTMNYGGQSWPAYS
ncbi:hypothetical protein [Bradyrhizobium sp. JR18.2]|uniref:hypothetical protein n=1 Tax=Bradyrhizobium sp. JR18.2 TaxID=3156369 RepID=UPI00339A723C